MILAEAGLDLSPFTPLAAFWVVFDGFFKATRFVNKMRDSVLSGRQDDSELSLLHRRVLYFDWKLTMGGFIGSQILLGGVLIKMAPIVSDYKQAIWGVSAITFCGAILFIICGLSDARAMKKVLYHTGKIEHQSTHLAKK